LEVLAGDKCHQLKIKHTVLKITFQRKLKYTELKKKERLFKFSEDCMEKLGNVNY